MPEMLRHFFSFALVRVSLTETLRHTLVYPENCAALSFALLHQAL